MAHLEEGREYPQPAILKKLMLQKKKNSELNSTPVRSGCPLFGRAGLSLDAARVWLVATPQRVAPSAATWERFSGTLFVETL